MNENSKIISIFLEKKKSDYQKQSLVLEKQEQIARTCLEDEPDREDIRKDSKKVRRMMEKYTFYVAAINEMEQEL